MPVSVVAQSNRAPPPVPAARDPARQAFPSGSRAKTSRRPWHVAARVLAAALLGYLVTNAVGVAVALMLPASKPSAVAGATIASFLLWR